MLNYSKLIFFVLIYCTLRSCNVSSLSDVIVPGGVENVAENAKLCTLDTAGIIEYYGYVRETRKVTTEDGYILTVYCLYNSTALDSSLTPIIAWHGHLDASHTFVLNYPDQSLAFLLADRGYYVCLPNARGNGFSQEYVNNSRNANIPISPYWRFSWDQIAEFDIPAVIDSVLKWTKKSNVIYIGHSQGTTTMFAALSSKPEVNKKVALFVALSPVTYFTHTQNPLYMAARNFEPVLDKFYGAEFSPHTMLQTFQQYVLCTLPTAALCANILFYMFGYSTHLDESRLPVYVCHSPADFAWGQFVQFVQHAKVDKFQKYDFKFRNQQKYGQSSPPEYDVTQISAPVALFHSDGDIVTNNVDTQKLKSQLSNCVFEQHLNASLDFYHMDYVWGKDVNEIVYPDLFNLIKNY